MKRRRASVVFALACAFLTPACRGDGSQAPAVLPTVAPPSEGPTVAPEPPLVPAAARKKPRAKKLELEVITGSPEGFFANSTLLSGEKEALLIDAQFTLADARKVAAAVAASQRTLVTVYVTHYHPDHYFGFPAIKEKFPKAKLVSLPQTVELIKQTWEAKHKEWEPLYRDGITSKPIVPEPLSGQTLELEGNQLEIRGGRQGDSADNSYVWIPSLRTVITGDLVYDGVFPWTAETTPAERTTWRATLDELQKLGASAVVPGHQKPERTKLPSSITFTKEYLAAYDEALALAKSSADLQRRIKARYPDTALDVAVRISADKAFPSKPSKKKPSKPKP